MKLKTILSSIMVATALGMAAPGAVAQNPGIVMAGSTDAASLPDGAKKFLDKHFKGVAVKECEKEYTSGEFEVKLVGGVEVDFNARGEVVEIDAPDRGILPTEVVKDVVPHKTFKHLQENGLASKVESVKYKNGKVIEIETVVVDPDTFIFDIDGNLLMIED